MLLCRAWFCWGCYAQTLHSTKRCCPSPTLVSLLCGVMALTVNLSVNKSPTQGSRMQFNRHMKGQAGWPQQRCIHIPHGTLWPYGGMPLCLRFVWWPLSRPHPPSRSSTAWTWQSVADLLNLVGECIRTWLDIPCLWDQHLLACSDVIFFHRQPGRLFKWPVCAWFPHGVSNACGICRVERKSQHDREQKVMCVTQLVWM